MQTDKQRLLIVLNNLLSNALRYHNHYIPKPYVSIHAQPNDNGYHISIKDNGIGMKSEHLDHIFEMFYRANEKKEGSGLGLHIVKEAVERMKGEITVSSEPNKGTTFELCLPDLQNSI